MWRSFVKIAPEGTKSPGTSVQGSSVNVNSLMCFPWMSSYSHASSPCVFTYNHTCFLIAMRASLLPSMFSYSHTCSFCRPFHRSWARYGKRVTKINIFFRHLIWTFKGALLLSRNCNNYFQGGFPPWLLKDYTANYMPRFRTMKNAGKWPQMLLLFNLIGVINCFVHLAASISYFLTAATNFSCWLSFLSFVFYLSLSLSVAIFSGWPSLACHLLSLFLCFSLSLYSKLVDVIINLSLIL